MPPKMLTKTIHCWLSLIISPHTMSPGIIKGKITRDIILIFVRKYPSMHDIRRDKAVICPSKSTPPAETKKMFRKSIEKNIAKKGVVTKNDARLFKSKLKYFIKTILIGLEVSIDSSICPSTISAFIIDFDVVITDKGRAIRAKFIPNSVSPGDEPYTNTKAIDPSSMNCRLQRTML